MSKYEFRRSEDYVRALREILQEIALLGLWRSKFFEKAAFYGGTALRVLYGLDRFSEDLDFSLLQPLPDFQLSKYSEALQTELRGFGFDARIEPRAKRALSPIQSAFLKADTIRQLLVIETAEEILRELPKGQVLKIKLEVDTDPPPGFSTEVKYLLQPIPFAVRSYMLPDLFAGKMHAILCRRWKTRVKGRDWYDFVWFISNHPALHLAHLERRLLQTGDLKKGETLTSEAFHARLRKTIETVNLDEARKEVEPFVKNRNSLAVWSKGFFIDIIQRIKLV
jgi:predicted nucleotidyltransferase component of viral defense system